MVLAVKITSKEGHEDLVKNTMIGLADQVRAEEGCLRFDLSGLSEKSNEFFIYEVWTNKALWQDHLKTDHMRAFELMVDRFCKDLHVQEYKLIKEGVQND